MGFWSYLFPSIIVIFILILIFSPDARSKFVPLSTRIVVKGFDSWKPPVNPEDVVGKSKGEKICRWYIENRFNRPFPTVRPTFLKSPETGCNLELDCYNEDMKLALEYNGRQHYVFGTSNTFHNAEYEFIAQVKRDQYKKKVCDDMEITLIIVPYTVSHEDIPDYIESKLKKAGF